jgi:tol-pal system protein YbgF
VLPPPPDSFGGGGTLTPPGVAAQPVAAGSGLRPPPGGALPGGALPDGSASDQYNYAWGLLKQQDYAAAEEALKAFVQQHPSDPMAGNAQYWLGETYYVRGRYSEAATAFAEGYKRYPKGAKAADDLLKLGMALGRSNQKQSACVVFVQLERDFPNPGSAIKENATRERKRLAC